MWKNTYSYALLDLTGCLKQHNYSVCRPLTFPFPVGKKVVVRSGNVFVLMLPGQDITLKVRSLENVRVHLSSVPQDQNTYIIKLSTQKLLSYAKQTTG